MQDLVRGWQTNKPQEIVEEIAKLLGGYRVSSVIGDRYSGEWVRQEFRQHGIEYKVAQITASAAFLELLPRINQGTVELLDDHKQTTQLLSLERRRNQGGREQISHPTGGHDDRAVALALAVAHMRHADCSEDSFWSGSPVSWSTMRNPLQWRD